MSIYSAVTGKSYEEIEAEFDGKGYGAFKPAVGEAVVELLRPIREEAARILADKAYLESVYKAGRGEGLLRGQQDPAQGL